MESYKIQIYGGDILTRYYCSGFDVNNAFGYRLGEMFRRELTDRKSIVFVPGGAEKIEKAGKKHIPAFIEHFKNVGIQFDNSELITPDLSEREAKNMIKKASLVMLMGGNPFKQKELCEKLGLLKELQDYEGVMVGFSAGAMLMSKYIIITPCSEEYPDFQIDAGLNLDNISIYPHNNTSNEDYPETLIVGDEIYQKEDLIKVANDYEEFCLLQDNVRENGMTDVSIIKSSNGKLEYYTENEGKIWKATKEGIKLQFRGECLNEYDVDKTLGKWNLRR